jgi:lipopolysaccharide export system protein LptA
VALLISAGVAVLYLKRMRSEERAWKEVPPSVPVTVQQQSAGFSFSKVEGQRTLFTVHATRAIEFKDSSRSLLEDVTVLIHGRDGTRHDVVHASKCNYDPSSGAIDCQGEIQMDFQSAADAEKQTADSMVTLETIDVQYDRETSMMWMPNEVTFRFAGGDGKGQGLKYNSDTGNTTLEKQVELRLTTSENEKAAPVVVTGSRLDYDRAGKMLRLAGPMTAKQEGMVLTAEVVDVALDDKYRARHAVATGEPVLRQMVAGVTSEVTAAKFVAEISPERIVEKLVADGGVNGNRKAPTGEDDFRADHAEIEMDAGENRTSTPKRLTAKGNVVLNSRLPTGTREIETAAMVCHFAAAAPGASRHIDSAESLAPGTITLTTPTDKTVLSAQRFHADFNGAGRLKRLLGHMNVKLRRTETGQEPEDVDSDESEIQYDAAGQWTQVDDRGHVHYRQADRNATASRARMIAATNVIELEGSPMVKDATSRTTAAHMTLRQDTGDVEGTGGVTSTYFPAPGAGGGAHAEGTTDAAGTTGGANRSAPMMNFGNGPTHVTSARLSGNSKRGQAIYSGNARMWQGDSVLEADEIEIQRLPGSLEGRGSVMAVFLGRAGDDGKSDKPVVWRVSAAHLLYTESDGRVHMTGGVRAVSTEATIRSQTLDVYLVTDSHGQRRLDHAVALGNVTVQQRDRQGAADRGDYFAADQKYVLSGGQPTLVDEENGTTTGHSLTFFQASDTILVESNTGTRTLTRHLVVK